MSKVKTKKVFLFLIALLLIFTMVSCGDSDLDDQDEELNQDDVANSNIANVALSAAYSQAKELGYQGTLDEFVALIRGKDGANGKDGVNGKDGITPTIEISEDGFWVVNGVKTEYNLSCDGVHTEACEHTNYSDFSTCIDATCVCWGVDVRICNECGYKDYRVMPAKGHSFDNNTSDYVIISNCSERKVIKSCSTCAIRVECEEEPTDAHFYVNAECSICGDKEPGTGIEYRLNSDEMSYSVASVGTCSDVDVIIPKIHEGLPVTSIGDFAFEGCQNLKSVIIPDGVTSIGRLAFAWCSSLDSVEIPESVISIGDSAFWYCFKLKEISLSDDLMFFGEGVLGCTGVTSIDISEENPFYYVKGGCLIERETGKLLLGFADSIIPDDKSVTAIADEAFAGCSGLTELVIPEGVTSIGASAFYCCGNLSSITFPNSLLIIGYNAFNSCSSLTEIVIPDGVVEIESNAFSWCSGIECVTIGKNLSTVGSYSFSNCYNLKEIIVDEENDYLKSIDGNLYSKDGKILIIYAAGKSEPEFIIPEEVDEIAEMAFAGCNALKSITLGRNVSCLGERILIFCSNIETINVDENNTNYKSIDGVLYSFDGKTLVVYPQKKSESVFVVPDGVTCIDEFAFEECNSLTCVIIPESVTTISDYAFYNCRNIVKFNYCGTEEAWNNISKGIGWDDYINSYTVIYNFEEN